jgi:hypothetical protein
MQSEFQVPGFSEMMVRAAFRICWTVNLAMREMISRTERLRKWITTLAVNTKCARGQACAEEDSKF